MSDQDKKNKIIDPFKEYHRAKDPSKREKAYYWRTAIGLQDVDGLTPSRYLLDTAKKQIEGEISMEEVGSRLNSYYAERREEEGERTQEADKVSARIAALLSEGGFTFSVAELLSIHRRLFDGIFPHAGKLRTYNITKMEWVLDGDTVTYGTAPELRATLEYDLEKEREFRYAGLSEAAIVHRLSLFLAGLWQIHPFAEGNTRTVAVFFIKYLRSLGYTSVTNDTFADHSFYFRNALVRANYTDLRSSVRATTEYLEIFLRNVLYDEGNPLKNRTLFAFPEKQDIERKKQYIEAEKQDIGQGKGEIGKLSGKTVGHIKALYSRFENKSVFGRKDVISLLRLSPAAASALLKKMLSLFVIEEVKGQGKGRYRFQAVL